MFHGRASQSNDRPVTSPLSSMTTLDFIIAPASVDELRVTLADGESADGDAELGALLALWGQLRTSDEPTNPHPVLAAELTVVTARIPQQLLTSTWDPRLRDWLMLSAAADMRGDLQLAKGMLSELLRLATASTAWRETPAYAATCWARIGRVLRQQGQQHIARDAYHSAIEIARPTGEREPWAIATQGLAALAMDTGNYPEADRLSREVVESCDTVHAQYRSGAYLNLSTFARRRGEHVLALEHGWTAFDLAAPDDPRRAMLLVNQADIGVALGALEESYRAYMYILSMQPVRNVRSVALMGLARTVHAALIRSDDHAQRPLWSQRARQIIGRVAETRDVIGDHAEITRLTLLAAEVLIDLGDHDAAHAWIDECAVVAKADGFHELTFIAEGLRELLETRRATAGMSAVAPPAASPPQPMVSAVSPHAGIRRLLAVTRAAHTI